jgi:hypothetical protein
MDEKFLAKIPAIVEAHMGNEHFTIEEFSGQAGIVTYIFTVKSRHFPDRVPPYSYGPLD